MRRIYLLCGFALVACSSNKPKTTTLPPPAATATADAEPAAAAPATAHVGVSDDLAKKCQLQFGNPVQAPKFDYDEFQLMSDDRALLEQVATCLTKGPLKDQPVRLVGRADPRGTEEYNLGLGSRRATTVREYLQRLGVSGNQLSQTTRGDLDANGSDETSWRSDRRVDLELRN
jgi:peptidoglycan-associated lipoprotein